MASDEFPKIFPFLDPNLGFDIFNYPIPVKFIF